MAYINVTLIDTKLSSYFYRFWSKSSLKYGVYLKFVSLLTRNSRPNDLKSANLPLILESFVKSHVDLISKAFNPLAL